jgi:uroporphyrinogen-III decarboxylase
MLSPKHVREFCIDYLPDVCTVYQYNVLHMCGKITPHLEASAEFLREVPGLATINVGPHVDIAATQELLQHKIGVAGNIDHIELLPMGDPADVEIAVHEAIKASGGDNRFMVAPGCEITSDTPIANIKAFVNAAQTYAG